MSLLVETLCWLLPYNHFQSFSAHVGVSLTVYWTIFTMIAQDRTRPPPLTHLSESERERGIGHGVDNGGTILPLYCYLDRAITVMHHPMGNKRETISLSLSHSSPLFSWIIKRPGIHRVSLTRFESLVSFLTYYCWQNIQTTCKLRGHIMSFVYKRWVSL